MYLSFCSLSVSSWPALLRGTRRSLSSCSRLQSCTCGPAPVTYSLLIPGKVTFTGKPQDEVLRQIVAAVGHRAENALIVSLVAPGCCEQARLPLGSRNQALTKKASSWAQTKFGPGVAVVGRSQVQRGCDPTVLWCS